MQQAAWKPSPHSDADAQCEFRYQPQGWARACRFLALRYENEPEAGAAEQYQLFATSAYTYRVFVTNLAEPIAAVVWFYNQRAGAENLIKEANNDAGLAAKVWRHAGRTGVSYSDQYQEKGLFERLMRRLRAMGPPGSSLAPVVEAALS